MKTSEMIGRLETIRDMIVRTLKTANVNHDQHHDAVIDLHVITGELLRKEHEATRDTSDPTVSYIAVKECSDGNESVGSMWLETRRFGGHESIDNVHAWASQILSGGGRLILTRESRR